MLLTKVTVADHVRLDFLHIEEASSSNADIFASSTYKPILNNYSRFLATFDDGTTIAEGMAEQALGYTFSIYKEIGNASQLIYVASLSEGDLSIIDYNVTNETTYRYYVFKEDESAISEAVVSNDVATCWWDWCLIDVLPIASTPDVYYADTNNIWKFDLNLSSAARTQNISVTTYNNLTKYPKISTGALNYSSGGITCLLGSVRRTSTSLAEYYEPASLLDDWNDFCANGNMKLLKDRKGNVLLVNITSTSAQTDDVTTQQANTITFNWVEVEDASDKSIIGV